MGKIEPFWNSIWTSKPKKISNTPLNLACWLGFEHIIVRLLQLGANPNLSNSKGYLPIHLVIHCGKVELVSLLLDNGCEMNSKNNDGNSPIRLSSGCGFVHMAELLLD